MRRFKAILEDAGSSPERVVDVTVFLTNIDRDFAAFNRVYGEYFEAIRPTRTTVGVVALPVLISVELKVIAEGGTGIPSGSSRREEAREAPTGE